MTSEKIVCDSKKKVLLTVAITASKRMAHWFIYQVLIIIIIIIIIKIIIIIITLISQSNLDQD